MFVVDASVWAARLMPVDAHHTASRAWLQARIESDELLLMPNVVLAEVAGAVARRTGWREDGDRAVSYLGGLPNVQILEIDTLLAELAADIASRQRLRGVDAFYVAVAQQVNVPLATWDREQRLRSASIVLAVEPSQTS